MDARETPLYIAILTTALLVLILVISFACTCIWFQQRAIRQYQARVCGEMQLLAKERQRLAADLHDELGALTAGIRLSLHSIHPASSADAYTLQRVHQHLHTLMKRMAEIAGNLLPDALVQKGLIAALQEVTHLCNTEGAIQVQLQSEPLPQLTEGISLHVYRMTHEIISNTIRHAAAKNLHIRFRLQGRYLLLHTDDNGTGFDACAALRKKSGNGLRNLIQRAALLSGRLTIDTAPGHGTRFFIQIPIR